jgi:UDP-2-acetamido-3-amino-2,3-dideoxy-glucuronate N-acetyltransferase
MRPKKQTARISSVFNGFIRLRINKISNFVEALMVNGAASVGEGTVTGEYCVIEEGAVLGKNCRIGHHVVISAAIIGDDVRIDDFACIGKLPMRAANSAAAVGGAPQAARIGDGCIIGTHAVIYAGATLGADVLVADHATVREDVLIGEKTIIGRGVAVENCCRIGSLCKIETGAYITAYSDLGDGCFIAPGVVTSNDNYVGRTKARIKAFKGVSVKSGGRVGAGAVILPGRVIGIDGFAAAGSVVTHDVPDGVVVAGNPARELKKVPEEQLLKNQ